MDLSIYDIVVFLAFFAFVVGFSMYKSRRGKDSEAYFLLRMMITFCTVAGAIAMLTWIAPRPEPRPMPKRSGLDLSNSPTAMAWGAAVIAGVAAFALVFR